MDISRASNASLYSLEPEEFKRMFQLEQLVRCCAQRAAFAALRGEAALQGMLGYVEKNLAEDGLSFLQREFAADGVPGRVLETFLQWKPSAQESQEFLRRFREEAEGFWRFRMTLCLRRRMADQNCPLITILGAAGAGKTTLARGLSTFGSDVFSLIPSYTSRMRRPTDLPGEYAQYGVNPGAFSEMRNRYLWVVRAHGNWYGTRKEDICNALADSGRFHILIVTPEGVELLEENGVTRERLFPVYLCSPGENVLRERLLGRGVCEQAVERQIDECRAWDAKAREGKFHLLETAEQSEQEVQEAFLNLLLG